MINQFINKFNTLEMRLLLALAKINNHPVSSPHLKKKKS